MSESEFYALIDGKNATIEQLTKERDEALAKYATYVSDNAYLKGRLDAELKKGEEMRIALAFVCANIERLNYASTQTVLEVCRLALCSEKKSTH